MKIMRKIMKVLEAIFELGKKVGAEVAAIRLTGAGARVELRKRYRRKKLLENNLLKRDEMEFIKSIGEHEMVPPNFPQTVIIVLFIVVVVSLSFMYERLYQEIVLNTTKSLIDVALDENTGISRVPFETLENLFRQYKIEISKQIKIVDTIESNIKTYIETHALNTNEGSKFEQIIRELKNIQELKRNREKIENIENITKREYERVAIAIIALVKTKKKKKEKTKNEIK